MPGLTHEDVATRSDRWLKILELPHMMSQSRLVENLWDLISWNEESLVEDAMQFGQSDAAAKGRPAGKYHLVRDEEVFLGEGVKLCPGRRARRVEGAGRGGPPREGRGELGAGGAVLRRAPTRRFAAVSLIRAGDEHRGHVARSAARCPTRS